MALDWNATTHLVQMAYKEALSGSMISAHNLQVSLFHGSTLHYVAEP